MSALPTGIVTFLLTDLEDSTRLWDRHPTLMAGCIARHEELVSSAVARAGGVVLKDRGEGDATLSVFARATAAVSAAVELQRLLHDEPWPPDVALRARVAVHTGEAYERDGDYFGPALNRAARLRSLASGGEVVMSRATADLVTDRLPPEVQLADLGHHELRGLTRGERVYRLVDRRSEGDLIAPLAPEFDAVPPSLPAPGLLVGRDAENHALTKVWKEAVAGERRVALVAGEPGIGKTALVASLAHAVHDDGAVVLHGRCDQDLAAPYQPWIEALRRYATRREWGRVAGQLASAGAPLGRMFPELRSGDGRRLRHVGLEPDADQLRLYDAVVDLLAAASTERPLLLVLDDLHWADRATLVLLRYVVRAADPMSVLICGTYRDTELGPANPLTETLADLRRERGVHRIALTGLAPRDVAQLVNWLAGHDVRADFVARIADRTAGNPFFVEEVLRQLATSGAVYQEDGRWRTSADIDDLLIPEGIREVVGRRVAELGEVAARSMTHAAAIGVEFSLDVLRRISDVDEDDLLDGLDAAVAARVLREVPGRPGRFRFRHALIREVLYTEVPSLRRLRMHARIAEALEASGRASPSELAHHRLAGALSTGDVATAVESARRAASEALSALAFGDAASYYRRALDLVHAADHDDPYTEVELYLGAGEALLRAGDHDEGQAMLLAGADVARDRGTPEQLAKIALAYPGLTVSDIGIVAAGVVDEPTIALLTEALERLPDGDSPLKALVLACLGRALITRPEESTRCLDAAVAMARRVGDGACLGRVLGFRHILLAASPDFAARQKMVREIVALASTTRDPILRLRAHLSAMVDALDAGDIVTADEERVAHERLARELRAPRQIMMSSWHRAMRALLDGRLDEVPALADAALADSDSVRWRGGPQAWGVVMIALAIERGDVGQWGPAVASFAEEYELPAWRSALAYIAAVSGDEDGARALLDELVDVDRSRLTLPFDRNWLIGAALLADTAARIGDAERASTLRVVLAPHANRSIIVNEAALYVYGSVHRVLGVSAVAAGDVDGSIEELSAAVDFETRLGATARRADSVAGLAAALVRRGRDADVTRARTLAADALAVAEPLGMRGVADQARRALSAAGGA
jgi:class 3 adenylate cyclase